MAIPHGCGNVAMPQYFLHGEKIDSGHNESRGQGMAQGVPTGSGDGIVNLSQIGLIFYLGPVT